jgi:hypothetical protein
MAATIPDLELSDVQAKKIVKLAIEHGAYSDDMPDDKAGRQEAAQEAISYCVDSWVNDGVRPDDDDPDFAAAGEAILEIFDAAGIETDDEGNILNVESSESEDDDPEAAEDGSEEAFNPDDYIEGWTEFTASEKVKALKDLDLEDEDTAGVVNSLRDWENEQDKVSSRVLSWIDENLGEAEGEPEAEGDTMEEPWEGYDGSTAQDIKAVLDEAMESDDGLEVEQVEYVKEYEESRKAPRKRVLDHCDMLIEKLSQPDEPEEEEKPKRRGGALAKKGGKRTAKPEPESNGMLTVTINGEEAGQFDAAELFTVIGAMAELIEQGATELSLNIE